MPKNRMEHEPKEGSLLSPSQRIDILAMIMLFDEVKKRWEKRPEIKNEIDDLFIMSGGITDRQKLESIFNQIKQKMIDELACPPAWFDDYNLHQIREARIEQIKKEEDEEITETTLTPNERLVAIQEMMPLTEFMEAYRHLDGEERAEFERLFKVGFETNDPTEEQKAFERLKQFFIDKLHYDPELFEDKNLLQWRLSNQKQLTKEEDMELMVSKLMPETIERISELRQEAIDIKLKKNRTPAMEARLQIIDRELKKLIDEKEEKASVEYKKKHKLSIS